MADIYAQHSAAFSRVSAFVILKDGERVATVTFKFPKDGAGRLYAYVHWIGSPMVRGFAGGYGYDKRSAAARHAAEKITLADPGFLAALLEDSGRYWDDRLRDAGFTVLQAV
jgi:hypothetical protein